MRTNKINKKFLKGNKLKIAIFIYTIISLLITVLILIILTLFDINLFDWISKMQSNNYLDNIEENNRTWYILILILSLWLIISIWIGMWFLLIFFIFAITSTWEKIKPIWGIVIFFISSFGMLFNFVFIPSWIMSFILWKQILKLKNIKINDELQKHLDEEPPLPPIPFSNGWINL